MRNLDAMRKLAKKLTGKSTITGDSIDEVIDFAAENFDVDGADGEDGLSVVAIALTTTEGAVTGGTATLSDGSTIDITVTET